MRHVLRNNKPSTYIIEFFEDTPGEFKVYDNKNNIYFYRDVPRHLNTIKVNIPDIGEYYFSENAIVKQTSLQVNPDVYKIKLPPRERNRDKGYYIVYDPKLMDSPAITYTDTGKIVTGRNFKGLSIPFKFFVLLHELGHFRYATEKYCDLFATIEMIKLGYNPSTAIYCLIDTLTHGTGKDERVNYIYSHLLNAGLVNAKYGLPTKNK